MTNEEKRNLLNSLLVGVLDAEGDGETCYWVCVQLTEHVASVLNELGYDNEFISLHKDHDGENDIFDLCHVAWDFSNYYNGKQFVWSAEDVC